MTRYVLDTNQIVAAGSAWIDVGAPVPDPVASRRLLLHVAEAETGLYCGKIAGEYLEKLLDRGHPPDRALRLVQYILGAFERVEVVTPTPPHMPSDPDDEIFVLCAIDGGAHYLISDDSDLLALRGHYEKPLICKAHEEARRLGI